MVGEGRDSRAVVMHNMKYVIPVFSGTIVRERLIDPLVRANDSTLVIAAPSGYGKSVLASQLASEFRAPTVWMDCATLDWSRERFYSALSQLVEPTSLSAQTSEPLTKPLSAVDMADRALVALAAISGDCGVTMVLDDVPKDADFGVIQELIDFLGPLSGCRVIVTTRWESPDIPSNLRSATMLFAENPSMSDLECLQILKRYLAVEPDPDMVAGLLGMSGGRAATLCVLARHIALGTIEMSPDGAVSGSTPLDLTVYLTELCDKQLDDRMKRLLFCCALLRSGTDIDIEKVLGKLSPADMVMLARLIPLLAVDEDAGRLRFRIHDIAADVYEDTLFATGRPMRLDADDLLAQVLESLSESGRYDSLFTLALRRAPSQTLFDWTERSGRILLDLGSYGLMGQVFDRLGAKWIARSPRILYLNARLLGDQLKYQEALTMASSAHELALVEDDEAVAIEALLLKSHLQFDLAMMGDAIQPLRMALEGRLSPDTRALALIHLGCCLQWMGSFEEATTCIEAAAELVEREALKPEVVARVMHCWCAIQVLHRGNFAEAHEAYKKISTENIPFSQQMLMKGNLAVFNLEKARLQYALELIEPLIERSRARGLVTLKHWMVNTSALANIGLGRYEEGSLLLEESYAGFSTQGYDFEAARSCMDRSVWLRSTGDYHAALAMSEKAFEHLDSCSCIWLEWMLKLDRAANLLALGEVGTARELAGEVSETTAKEGAAQHALIAAMILADIDRRDGRLDDAVERLSHHVDHILTESSNWWTGMYIRSFPHLLGLIAENIDPERLSIYLLRMVLPQDADRVLDAAREVMSCDDAWERLAIRITDEADSLHHDSEDSDSTPRCRVKMFGGLEVRVGNRVIREKDWKKRKARLLFMMLIVRQGKDVPADVIHDCLWPDKTTDKARNNLYVIWSAMKAALMYRPTRAKRLPYVENVGGLCRMVVGTVDLDIAEFGHLTTRAAEAERSGDVEAAIEHYVCLDEIYAGDLLPGDLYEDWFAEERDRYRIAFGDAMLRATKLAMDAGKTSEALKFAWSGVSADSGREDLCQSLMRCLIATGQRTIAIEVYMKCREKLIEDFGLDPSAETVALYKQILSMEEPDCIDSV